MSDFTKVEGDLLAKVTIFDDVIDGRQPFSKLREILTDDEGDAAQRQINWLQFAVLNRTAKYIRLMGRARLAQEQQLPLREKPKDGGN